MELHVYDRDLTLLGVVDNITSLVWTRRYWNVGDFKLLVPFTENNINLLEKYNLVMKNGDLEAGQIKYVNICKNAFGYEQIEVSGKFISNWLDSRIVLNQITTTDNSQNLINRIVNANMVNPTDVKRTIPRLKLEENQTDLESGTIDYTSTQYETALTNIGNLAKGAKLGFKIVTDVKNKKYIFKIYKGKDFTIDSADKPCIFSQDFDNVQEEEFTSSVENLRNFGYVGGEELENINRKIVEIGTAMGFDREEIFINASDISQTIKNEDDTEIVLSAEEYTKLLTTRGITTLEYYPENLNFSSKINPRSNLVYKVDFDVGDRVTCVNKRWGIKINVRITEVTETFQDNKSEIDIVFGESLPTLFEKLKL